MVESGALLIGFLIAIGLGIVTAVIANEKGYSPAVWGLLGFAFAIIALPMILLMPVNGDTAAAIQSGSTKQCPYCAEIIQRAAKVCRYCGKDQPPNTLQNKCPQCGLVNFATAEVCRHCETAL